MKHEWEMLDGVEKVIKYGFDPVRQCQNCGVIQQKYSETEWGRVTKSGWEPKVGKCKKDP